MTLITVTTGQENFNRQSAKFYAFVCRSRANPSLNPTEKHLFNAAKNADPGFTKHGPGTWIDAAPGMKEVTGKWGTQQFDVPEGTMIKLYGQRKLSAMVSGRETKACVLLRVRAEAAFVRVSGILTGHARAHSATVEAILAPADVLTLEQAANEGFILLPHFRSMFESYNVDALFSVAELRQAISIMTPPVESVVTNTQGEEVRVASPRRRRALQV